MRGRILTVVALCSVCSVCSAQGPGVDLPDDLLVCSYDGLFRTSIDTLLDVATIIDELGLRLTDLAPSPVPWQMYGLFRETSGLYYLQRRRQKDGQVVASVPLINVPTALAYDSVRDRILVAYVTGLYQINPATGDRIRLSGAPSDIITLAFHEGYGVLYGASPNPPTLWGWDEASGEWANIGAMATATAAMAYNPADGQLYVAARSQDAGTTDYTDSLFRVDAGTARRVEIGEFAYRVVEGSSGLVFTTEPHCYADCDGDGVLDVFDLLSFMNLFDDGDDLADCNQDGTLNVFDFICFQSHFAAGCD